MKPLTKMLNPERFYVDENYSTPNLGLLIEIKDSLERSIRSGYGRRLLQRLVGEPYTVKADWRFRVWEVAVDEDGYRLFRIYALDRDDYPLHCICPRDDCKW
jgi:hypothetical protein